MHPIISKITKIPRQPINPKTEPPTTGAAIGAIPLMAPTIAKAFAAFKLIGCNGSGNHNSAGSGNSLQEAQQNKYLDIRSENTGGCRKNKQPHRKNQRPAAAYFIAERAEYQLPESQSQH